MTPTEPPSNRETLPISTSMKYGIATAMLGMFGGDMPLSRRLGRQVKAPRPCIICKTPHTGNNAFCSAECCRAHKTKGTP